MAQCLFCIKKFSPRVLFFQNKKVEEGSKPGSLLIEWNAVIKILVENVNGVEVVVCRVLSLFDKHYNKWYMSTSGKR